MIAGGFLLNFCRRYFASRRKKLRIFIEINRQKCYNIFIIEILKYCAFFAAPEGSLI